MLLNAGCALADSLLVHSLHACHLRVCAEVDDSHQRPVLVPLLALCMPPVHARRSFGGSGAGWLRVHCPSRCAHCQMLVSQLHRCPLCSQENPLLPVGLVLGMSQHHACLGRGLCC